MNYVFDIDGTLCTNTQGDYSKAKPFVKRIQKINELFDQGNRIILFTARGMGTNDNNVEIAKSKWEALTKEQLTVWGDSQEGIDILNLVKK